MTQMCKFKYAVIISVLLLLSISFSSPVNANINTQGMNIEVSKEGDEVSGFTIDAVTAVFS